MDVSRITCLVDLVDSCRDLNLGIIIRIVIEGAIKISGNHVLTGHWLVVDISDSCTMTSCCYVVESIGDSLE